MTVRELIEKLEAVENKDLIVVMSRDEEGNGFKLFATPFVFGRSSSRATRTASNARLGTDTGAGSEY